MGRLSHSLIALLAGCLCASGQDGAVVFRSSVSLVRVDAEVVDAAGNLVTDLRQGDFVIRDQGVAQKVVNFSFEKEPLDLILLFDTSGAMHSKVHQVLRAVELGFHELQKGDRVCVMAYSSNSFEVAPFTSDLDAVNQTILLKVLGLKFGGSSNLAGAAGDAAVRFRREPVDTRRRAVLAVSDRVTPGADMRAIQSLWQSDVVLGELVIDKPGSTRVVGTGGNPLADRSGGATLVAGDPGAAFQESLRRLRRRYTLYYALPQASAGTQRTMDVQLTPQAAGRYPGGSVRARTGYVVRTPDVP